MKSLWLMYGAPCLKTENIGEFLLCPWLVHASSNRQYLFPSMLMSCPASELSELVESANISSLFVKFSSGEVPPAFFPSAGRTVHSVGRRKILIRRDSSLYTSEDACSVIFICHFSSVEVFVHGGNSAPSLPSSGEETCACKVCRQLSLILECMRNQFPWLENMKCVSYVPSAPKKGKLRFVKPMVQKYTNRNNAFTSGLCLNCLVTLELSPAGGPLLLETPQLRSASFTVGFLLQRCGVVT